jgi:hypothetical protein
MLCFVTALLSSHEMTWLSMGSSSLQPLCTTMAALATVTSLFYMAQACPQSTHFGGSILHVQQDSHLSDDSEDSNGSGHASNTNGPGSSLPSPPVSYFQTPCVPYLPAIGMFVNWYLIAQLEVRAMFLLALYLGVAVSVYLWLCAPYSVGHTTRGWSITAASRGSNSRYESVVLLESEEEQEDHEDGDGVIAMSVFSESLAQQKSTSTTRRGSGSGVVS